MLTMLMALANAGPLDDALRARDEADSGGLNAALAETRPPTALSVPYSPEDRARLLARWALLDHQGKFCQVDTERIEALLHADLDIPYRKRQTSFGPTPDEAAAREWLEQRNLAHLAPRFPTLPTSADLVISTIDDCHDTWALRDRLRKALETTGKGAEKGPLQGVNNLDALELLELRHTAPTTRIDQQDVLERRMVTVLERYPDSTRVRDDATLLQRQLTFDREHLAHCGGLCAFAAQVVEAAQSDTDRIRREGRCASIVAEARSVRIPRAIDERLATHDTAVLGYALRGATCVESTHISPGFPDLEAVKAHVGSCATVDSDDWLPWLRASRRAAIDGCAPVPSWAENG